MGQDVHGDQLAIIKIEGMHCHKCEQTLQKALLAQPGVHEVEVDFPTGQASVLFDFDSITVSQLMQAVNGAGYHATGFTQRQTDTPRPSHPSS
ncbi:MAG: heavy-metal-associated domain-containing protein [Tepidisphaeraceae bacterium]